MDGEDCGGLVRTKYDAQQSTGSGGRRRGKGKKLSQILESGVAKSHETAAARRSVDLRWIFFQLVGRGFLGDKDRLATLLMLSRFDCVEPLAKPGFFRPAPVAVDV
jgi:hypothetical protein